MSEAGQSESITPEGIEALRAELEELEGPRRSEMSERIKEARELGDLKENADYHIAKDDQGHLEARIRRLRERLRKATVVEAADAPADSFAFGRTTKVVEEGTGKITIWTLVGSTEADLGAGKLSIESPVGRALRDTAVGDAVSVETPRGKKTYRVQKLIEG